MEEKKFIIMFKLMFGGWKIHKANVLEEELLEFMQNKTSADLLNYIFIKGSVVQPKLSYTDVQLEVEEVEKVEEERTFVVPELNSQGSENEEENNQGAV